MGLAVQSKPTTTSDSTAMPRVGPQCRSLPVTLRIGPLEDGTTSLDHEATWLLGHTQHITFSKSGRTEGELYVEAMLHVPCRYLRRDGASAQLYRPRIPGTYPAGRLPAGPASPSRSGPLPDRGEPSNGGPDAAAPRAEPPGARRRRTPAPWLPAGPRITPGAPPAAVTSRSRSCVPSGNVGSRPWCAPADRRISAR